LVLGDLGKEFVEGSAIENPVQSDAGHNSRRSVLEKRVEDGRQDQQNLSGWRIELQVIREVTLENLRMFTGVAVPTLRRTGGVHLFPRPQQLF